VLRRQLDREMDEEILSHLEFASADFREQGLTAEQAARAARRHFGSVSQTKDAERDSRGFRAFEDLLRDVSYALRGFRRNPATAFVIVAILSLGIGATVTIFSAVDAVLLKTLPIANPDGVVSVHTVSEPNATANPSAGNQLGTTSYPNYLDLRDSGALQSLAAFAPAAMTLDVEGATERIDVQIVTGNYFELLGIRSLVGRVFLPDDDRIESPRRVAVLAYQTWSKRYGSRPDIVGQTLTLNGKPYTVIGVAPRGFFGSLLGDAPELWVPMALQPEVRPPSAGVLRQRMSISTSGRTSIGALLDFRDVSWLELVGRLKDGSSLSKAAAAVDVIGRRLSATYPDANGGRSFTALHVGEAPGLRTRARPVLQLLSVAVGIVLAIACANVASLLLARAVSRRREVAVRIAIGAGHGRLLRQWLTESVLLGMLGGLGGLIVAIWATPVLYGLGVLEAIDLSVNPRVFGFALVAGVITGITFGLASTAQLFQHSALPALRDEGNAVASGVQSTRLRNVFIVAQVGLSLILLVGAGLFIRTFREALEVDLGYRVEGMLLAEVSPGDRYSPPEALSFYRELLQRINALPGVVSAAAARVTVLSGAARTVPVSVDGKPLRRDSSNVLTVRTNVVSDRYLQTMGIPLMRGRGIQAADVVTAPRVAVVSQALARRLWPGAEPVGQLLFTESARPFQVVGVAPDTVYRSATDRDPRPFYYVPLEQNYEAGVTLHIRTSGDPMALVAAVRRTLRDLDPAIPLLRPRRLIDEFNRSTMPQRTMAMLVGSLSVVSLLLAAVGLYGVMAFVARQRTTEVGLRMALGATPRSILCLVVMRGVRLVAVGAMLGLVGAALSARFVRGLLFGVAPNDPITWLIVAGVLMAVALMACAIPAARSMRIQPATALRAL